MENFLQLIFLIQIALTDLTLINPLILILFFVLAIVLGSILIIYIRYCYYRAKLRKKFYREAEAILMQRGQQFTSHMKRGIVELLDASEQKFSRNQ